MEGVVPYRGRDGVVVDAVFDCEEGMDMELYAAVQLKNIDLGSGKWFGFENDDKYEKKNRNNKRAEFEFDRIARA